MLKPNSSDMYIIHLMHIKSQNRKCSLVWRQVCITGSNTNKHRQLICGPIRYAPESTSHACETNVVCAVCFIVLPPNEILQHQCMKSIGRWSGMTYVETGVTMEKVWMTQSEWKPSFVLTLLYNKFLSYLKKVSKAPWCRNASGSYSSCTSYKNENYFADELCT